MSFTIPENLNELSVDEILDSINLAKTEAKSLLGKDSPSDEEVNAAEEALKYVDEAKGRISEVQAAAAEKDERLSTLKAKADEEDEEAEAEESPADEVPVDEAPAEEAPTDEVEEDEKSKERQAVAASAAVPTKSAAARAKANSKEPEAPMNHNAVTITAAADINGITAGATLKDDVSLTAAAMKRLQSFPRTRQGGANGIQMRAGIATVDVGAARTDGMFQGNADYTDDQAVLTAAAGEKRLKSDLGSGSLTAAGGWCAPTETLEAFCDEVSTDGILDLPSMTVKRGSVRYTKGPDFSAIFDNANGDWNYTETQVIADTVKPCIEVECPTWDDITLDVTGVCIKAGILTNAAYPELVRAYVQNVLIAHQHKVASRLYQGIVAVSTAVNIAGGVTATDGIGHLEVAANLLRQKKRMAMNTTVEVLLPFWYKSVIRGDVSARTGIDMLNVSDATITSYFATRQLAVQWLYNTGQDIDLTTGTLSLPETVNAVMYTAGTFVKLTNDLITIEGLYDSTNLSTNTYTALFTEEGWALANMCGDGYTVEIPTCASGVTGAANQTKCLVPATVVV